MARLIGEQRDGSINLRRNRGINALETSIKYLVEGSSNTATREEIVTCPGVPQLGQEHPIYGTVVGVDAQRRSEKPTIWDVTLSTSTSVDIGQNRSQSYSEQQSNPLAWVPIADVTFETYEEKLSYALDEDGEPTVLYANSINETFNQGIVIPRTYSRWDFFQMEPIDLMYREIGERNNAINKTTFVACRAKSLRLSVTKATVYRFFSQLFWLVEYSITYKDDGTWEQVEPDIGQGKDPFLAIEEGTPLDGAGNALAQGADPAKLKFRRHREIEFNDFLRLPNTPL